MRSALLVAAIALMAGGFTGCCTTSSCGTGGMGCSTGGCDSFGGGMTAGCGCDSGSGGCSSGACGGGRMGFLGNRPRRTLASPGLCGLGTKFGLNGIGCSGGGCDSSPAPAAGFFTQCRDVSSRFSGGLGLGCRSGGCDSGCDSGGCDSGGCDSGGCDGGGACGGGGCDGLGGGGKGILSGGIKANLGLGGGFASASCGDGCATGNCGNGSGCATGNCGDGCANGNCGNGLGGLVGGGAGAGAGSGVALTGGQFGCGRGGCGAGGRLCAGCIGRGGLRGRGGNMFGNPYGNIPHTPAVGPHGPGAGQGGGPVGAYAYPYYTTRGPRDFLMCNPPSIGY